VQRTAKGGSRPYQVFSEADLTAARMIRLQQSPGYSLAEIAALRQQIERLESKKQSIDGALNFLNAKLQWVEAGKPADAPHPENYFC
jgi:DNA-binding transcriptional MerR regulator